MKTMQHFLLALIIVDCDCLESEGNTYYCPPYIGNSEEKKEFPQSDWINLRMHRFASIFLFSCLIWSGLITMIYSTMMSKCYKLIIKKPFKSIVKCIYETALDQNFFSSFPCFHTFSYWKFHTWSRDSCRQLSQNMNWYAKHVRERVEGTSGNNDS